MMNQNEGWMNAWMGGGTGAWILIGTVTAFMLVAAIIKLSKK